MVAAGVDEDISGYDQKPSWDVAVRYQDLKKLLSIPDKEKRKLRRRAINGVLQQARSLLGSVMKPEKPAILTWQEFWQQGGRGDVDLLSTIDVGISSGAHKIDSVASLDWLRFESRQTKETDIILVMDASLSMTGEKIALLAVAAAVVSFCVPTTNLCLIAFSSQGKVIKGFQEVIDIPEIVERVLEIPAYGLTNLEAGLLETIKVQQEKRRAQSNVILISDGKYTEGKDPSYLAHRFQKLHALKLGRDVAGLALLRELTSIGNGVLFEARRPHDLPKTMYAAMKQLLI